MRTEESIREALQREADSHRVNPTLPRSAVLKARLSRAAIVTAGIAAVVGIVFGGAGLVRGMDDSRGGIGVAGGPTTTIGEAPLLLITAEGWRVERVDQQLDFDMGDTSFTDGTYDMELTWRTEEEHDDYLRDRMAEAGETWDIVLAGRDATLVQYEGTTDFTALWLDGDLSLELRGVFPAVDEYRAVAETLQQVDEETWLAALPDETVTPDERAAVVEAMLEDVPVHPDSGIARVKKADIVSDRYQLGAQVTGAVTCAWIRQWVQATDRGDETGAREAVDAMKTSKRWAILVEIERQGGWSATVWDFADAMAGKGEVLGGGPTTIEESYRSAFGCRDEPKD